MGLKREYTALHHHNISVGHQSYASGKAKHIEKTCQKLAMKGCYRNLEAELL